MPAISIIMPIYNSEKYLEDAILSILNQTFLDFELLLVNDGSTDSSQLICNKYEQKDNRVRAFYQKNQGISAARNLGIENAIGEYIAFADNDDIFKKDLLKDNYEEAIKHDAEIVKFGIEYYSNELNENFEEIQISSLNNKTVFNNTMEYYELIKDQNLLVYVWDALYKKEIVKKNNLRFIEEMKFGGEDVNFNLKFFPHAKKIVYNPKKYYVHYKRKNHSTVMIFNENKLNSYLLNAEEEFKILSMNKRIWANSASLYIIQYYQAINIFIPENDLINKKKFTDKVRKNEIFGSLSLLNVFSLFLKNKKRAIILLMYLLKLDSLLLKTLQLASRSQVK